MKKGLLLASAALVAGATMQAVAATPAARFAPARVGNVEAVKAVKALSLQKKSAALSKASILRGAEFGRYAVAQSPVFKADPLWGDTVFYVPQDGVFFTGMSDDGYRPVVCWMLAPAYQKLTWTNKSTATGTPSWKYVDMDKSLEQGEVVWATSSEKDFVQGEWPMMTQATPTLTIGSKSFGGVIQDGQSAKGYYLQTSGNLDLTADGGKKYYSALFNAYAPFTEGGWAYGNSTDEEAELLKYYQEQYGGTGLGTDASKVKITGFGQLFPYTSPYALWGGRFMLRAEGAKDDAQVTVKIYKVTVDAETGQYQVTDEVLSESTVALSDASVMGESGSIKLYNVSFKTAVPDPIVGTVEGAVNVTTPIYVEISGLENTNGDFMPWSDTKDRFTIDQWKAIQSVSDLPYSINAYTNFTLTYKGEDIPMMDAMGLSAYYANDARTEVMPFPYIDLGLDIEYNYLHTTEATEWTAPVAGGDHTFNVESNWAAYTAADGSDHPWTVAEEENGELPEWLTYSWTNGTVEQNGTTYYNDETAITLTAAALPSDVKGRASNFTVQYPGASLKLRVSQGDVSGVDGATVATAAKVVVEGGNFAVSADGAKSVAVYNVAGQKVAEAALSEGTTYVDGQNLANGLYIFKFDNNTAVKVVK